MPSTVTALLLKLYFCRCSYNALNGVPMCANRELLTGKLRGDWQFTGYVVTDCNAFDAIHTDHHFTPSLEATINVSYGAGSDLYNCGRLRSKQLEEFMAQSAANEAMLTKSLGHLFGVQMRLGFFDPPELNPYSKLNIKDDVDTPSARALAKEAADQSLVLLLNRGGTLPLSSSLKHLALIGPNANATSTMQGNYATTDPPFLMSPLDGFVKLIGRPVDYVQGCGVAVPPKPAGIAAAVAAANGAEAVCVVAGLDGKQEGEGHDRSSLLLPSGQSALIKAVAAAASKPIVVLLMSGSALDVSSLVSNPQVGALLWVGYPGQAGGTAIAEAVMGITAPSGRLPMTWYFSNYTTQVKKTQMALRPSAGYPGRTYRFVNEPVLFGFGWGLSYTTFHTTASAPATLSFQEARAQLEKTRNAPHLAPTLITPRVSVENTGTLQCDHIVLLFLSPPGAGQAGRPLRQLRQFERIRGPKPGATAEVALPLTSHDFALAGEDGTLAIIPGVWKLRVDKSEVTIHVGPPPLADEPRSEWVSRLKTDDSGDAGAHAAPPAFLRTTEACISIHGCSLRLRTEPFSVGGRL